MVTMSDCQKLKKHGFMWFKDGTTDRVESDCIASIFPTSNGLKVIYTNDSALISSTAVVVNINIPDNQEIEWAYVEWSSIDDERR